MGQEDQSRKGRLILMPHVSCLVHLVFSTSGRQPTIREQMRDQLHPYLGGIARENAMVAIAVGGVADHVHLLLSLPSTVPIACYDCSEKEMIRALAGLSSWHRYRRLVLRSIQTLSWVSSTSVRISVQRTSGPWIT